MASTKRYGLLDLAFLFAVASCAGNGEPGEGGSLSSGAGGGESAEGGSLSSGAGGGGPGAGGSLSSGAGGADASRTLVCPSEQGVERFDVDGVSVLGSAVSSILVTSGENGMEILIQSTVPGGRRYEARFNLFSMPVATSFPGNRSTALFYSSYDSVSPGDGGPGISKTYRWDYLRGTLTYLLTDSGGCGTLDVTVEGQTPNLHVTGTFVRVVRICPHDVTSGQCGAVGAGGAGGAPGIEGGAIESGADQ